MTETVEVKLTLPRSILAAAGVPEREIDALLRETLAVALYRQGRISLGKAAELAGAQTKLEMLATLQRYGIPLNYTAEDAEADWETLRKLWQNTTPNIHSYGIIRADEPVCIE